ncbi:Intramembrane protease 2 [Ceratocystis platani]|uniref:Intramembrane protease 2 n=1 Tax=Ceratocystis fimbriata f. sp. platani TaxID=88771 RepID=A0A0F8DJ40_CERFI|nr:Intramembrane protease 2 [Ceratocystis platani]
MPSSSEIAGIVDLLIQLVGASGSESDSDDDDADEYDPALQAGLDASDAVLLPILSALVLYGMYCLLKYLDDPTLLSRIALILATSLIFPRIWRARDGTLYEVCPEKSGHIRLMQSGPGGIIVTRGLPMRERVTLRIQHIAGLVLAVATVAGPLMITVATKLDAPIKLVASTAGRKGSMLGLGDIVVPGIVMAMALRFDLWRHYAKKIKYETVELKTTTASPSTEELADPSIILTSQQRTMATKARYISVANKWGDWLWTLPSIFGRSSSSAMGPLPLSLSGTQFSKTYFVASMIGYVAGLLAAMGCMLVFKHGQPALLYLVPAVLGAVWGTGTLRGEIGLMLKYTEDGSLDTKERIVEVDADGRPVQSEEEKKRNEEKKKEHDMKTRTRKPGKDILVFKITQVAIKTKRK